MENRVCSFKMSQWQSFNSLSVNHKTFKPVQFTYWFLTKLPILFLTCGFYSLRQRSKEIVNGEF
jgi:hypothetical protein